MTHWMLITGYPTETEEDFEQTLQLIEQFKKYRDKITLSFVSFILLPDSPIAYQSKYDHIKFVKEHEDRDLVNYWLYENNPTLNFNERLRRFETARQFGLDCGYGTNIDKFKKTIMNVKETHVSQILS